MYSWVLALHSGLRWIVLLAGIVVVVRALQRRNRPWSPTDGWTGKAFVASLDLQLLFGLVLLFFGPVTVMAWHEPDLMMRSKLLRFFTLEHPVLMLIGITLAHIGSVRIRRSRDDRTRHRRALWFYGAAMALILAGIPWPFLSYGRPLLSMLP